MRLVIQRVSQAAVSVDNELVAKIGQGMLVLVGFGQKDEESLLSGATKKLIEMRIFADSSGRFNKSVQDVAGEILLVPQFTLYANCQNGRRPDFISALAPAPAQELFSKFYQTTLSLLPERVQAGIFGAMMEVELINSGPVTICLQDEDLQRG